MKKSQNLLFVVSELVAGSREGKSLYSQVPIKQVAPNKQVGWIF